MAEEEDNRQENPVLENLVILTRIFGFLPNTTDTQALQSFRQVGSAWYRAVYPLWNALAAVRLVEDEGLEDLQNRIESLRRYFEEIDRNRHEEVFIHRNFTLISWVLHEDSFTPGGAGGNNLNRRFWQFCGPNIRSLTLRKCVIPNNFSVLPLDLWRAVPNLERLTLLDCHMTLNTKKHFPQCNAEIQHGKVVGQRKADTEMKIQEIKEELEKPGTVQRQTELTATLGELEGTLNNLTVEERRLCIWLGYPWLPLIEHARMKRVLLDNLTALLKTPPQLRYLEIKNLKSYDSLVEIHWSQDNNIFPKLEKLVVREQDHSRILIPEVSTLQRRLTEVHVLKYFNHTERMSCPNLLNIPTRKLSFDCGFETPGTDVHFTLTRRHGGLEQLCLFRAPFRMPYRNFPCPNKCNLTELEIWGNVDRNLNFLGNFPTLKKLTWITSCYDEETHAFRLHRMLGQRTTLLSSEHIVSNTDLLDDNFVHANMESIHLECGPLSLTSLLLLKKWLPNLTTFKVAVVEDEQLVQIGTQWPNLENLELAHGSSVTAGGILNAIFTHDVFQRINRFIWRGCPCYHGALGDEESRVVDELKRRCGETFVHPWREPEQEASGTNPPAVEDCLRALFERALPGEEDNVRIFADAFLRVSVVNE